MSPSVLSHISPVRDPKHQPTGKLVVPNVRVRDAQVEGPYRWMLSRWWGSGPQILWIGCNPSTADARKDDPTILREMGFSARWGFGSMLKMNFYPFIAPHTDDLHAWLTGDQAVVAEAMAKNHRMVATAVITTEFVVACWGNLVAPDAIEPWLQQVHEQRRRPVKWHCIGTTKSGAPTHPMARGKHSVKDDQQPIIWRDAA